MKSNIEGINIKILGSWNPKIFQPAWLIKNLSFNNFELTKENINFLFNFEEIEIGYEFNGIRILPRDKLLTILIAQKENFSDEKVIYITEIMLAILSLLPHTPLKGLGFNICYKFPKDIENEFIQLLFKTDNNIKGFNINQNIFSKVLKGYKINLISIFNEEYVIEFNFHYDKLVHFDSKIFLKHIQESERYLYNE